jgi:hypothetical protein
LEVRVIFSIPHSIVYRWNGSIVFRKPAGRKRGIPTPLAMLAACVCVWATEPNYVRTKVFQINDIGNSGDSAVSTSYSDGLGRDIQSQAIFNSVTGNKDTSIVTGTYYDAAGRDSVTVKPFAYNVTNAFLEDGGPGAKLMNKANDYYDNSTFGEAGGTNAFSETRYYDDPLSRPMILAAPGDSFCIGNGHTTKFWYFGSSNNNWFFPYDSLQKLMNSETVVQPENSVYDYFLTVTKSPNDSAITQEVKDIFGRTIATSTVVQPLNRDADITSQMSYDILGNVLEEIPPSNYTGADHLISRTKYTYNTLGQDSVKITPDAGKVVYRYDAAGRLRYVQNQEQRNDSTCLIYSYDNLGRLITIVRKTSCPQDSFNALDVNASPIGSNDAPNTYIVIRKFYDVFPDWAIVDNDSYANLYLTPTDKSDIQDQIASRNLRGRLVLEIAYDKRIVTINGTAAEVKTGFADFYGYDDEGRLQVQYKIIPDLPRQRFEYVYDLQGKLVTQIYRSGDEAPQYRSFFYDNNGRLAQAVGGSTRDRNQVVSYDYFKHGLIKSRKFHRNSSDAGKFSYYYNIRDWMKGLGNFALLFDSASHPTNQTDFAEKLEYASASTFYNRQYNGNIAAAEYYYGHASDSTATRFEYAYDGANRLIRVKAFDSLATEFHRPAQGFDALDEAFGYDNAGRFFTKTKASLDPDTTKPYSYYAAADTVLYHGDTTRYTSRLNGIGPTGAESYIYDANGNMIYDKTKKMSIAYDWRDMPVTFSFYSAQQDLSPNGLGERGSGSLVASQVVSRVSMYYDASGNRVYKVENAAGAQ